VVALNLDGRISWVDGEATEALETAGPPVGLGRAVAAGGMIARARAR